MSLDAPAPAPGAGPPANRHRRHVAAPPVGDASPMADPGRGRRRLKATRVVSANISVGRRLAEIWRSRELLVYLVRTEIKVKYKNSFLGLMWSMLRRP